MRPSGTFIDGTSTKIGSSTWSKDTLYYCRKFSLINRSTVFCGFNGGDYESVVIILAVDAAAVRTTVRTKAAKIIMTVLSALWTFKDYISRHMHSQLVSDQQL